MGKENKKGSRRRGSQAFQFEQSEETLQQNETICNLYQNKNYVPPDPGELEVVIGVYWRCCIVAFASNKFCPFNLPMAQPFRPTKQPLLHYNKTTPDNEIIGQ